MHRTGNWLLHTITMSQTMYPQPLSSWLMPASPPQSTPSPSSSIQSHHSVALVSSQHLCSATFHHQRSSSQTSRQPCGHIVAGIQLASHTDHADIAPGIEHTSRPSSHSNRSGRPVTLSPSSRHNAPGIALAWWYHHRLIAADVPSQRHRHREHIAQASGYIVQSTRQTRQ
jgi:hypothetical protein